MQKFKQTLPYGNEDFDHFSELKLGCFKFLPK
jgi:hypothetical protein